jgi:IrrE N-terminal-like domain
VFLLNIFPSLPAILNIDVLVPRCSCSEISHKPHFDIISAIENGLVQHLQGFTLEVRSQKELGKIEAFTEFNPVRIVVREDIYEGAYKDDTRARFTLAHELGHLCLHWGYPRPRLAPEAQKSNDPSAKGRVEKEANQFAAAFLMPRSVATKIDEPRRLASLCRVSDKAASYRLHDLWGQNESLSTEGVRKLFGTD